MSPIEPHSMPKLRAGLAVAALLLSSLAAPWPVSAEMPAPFDSGKLLATGGVSNVEGAGGGGVSTWALITGYGTRDGVGANVHGTYVHLGDFDLTTTGAAIGLYDRLEVSYAHQFFDTRRFGAALGLGKNYTFEQDILGAKVRLFGNAVYDQDTLLPQVSVGVQLKQNQNTKVVRSIGAKSDQGADFYVAFSKLLLDQSLLLNATLRLTKANELGILGFGGDRHNAYQPQFEGSVAYLLTRQIAIGGEYRTMPRNLSISKEGDWKTAFIAWFPLKNLSVTLAYANLGTVATKKNEQGVYLSTQIGF